VVFFSASSGHVFAFCRSLLVLLHRVGSWFNGSLTLFNASRSCLLGSRAAAFAYGLFLRFSADAPSV